VPSSSTSTIVGWTLSFIIYFIIVAGGIYMLQSHNTKTIKYTASKKNLLNVTLVERKEKKVVKKKKQKIVKKKTTVNRPKTAPKKKTVRVKKSEIKPDFKKLFGKIDLDKLPKQSPKREKKVRKKVVQKKFDEVTKEDLAKKAVDSLEIEKQQMLNEISQDAIYDKFKGEVTDILYVHWQETTHMFEGNIAVVSVKIDKLGNFSYKIETLSYNDAFNAKLRDFLEEMRDIEFPPYEGGKIFNMQTTFKDELE
jgi:protein TonB